MAKKTNNEQDDINRERLVDIVLIIKYMKKLDVNKEFFTDEGNGFLKGLASVKDEIKFVSKEEYDNLVLDSENNLMKLEKLLGREQKKVEELEIVKDNLNQLIADIRKHRDNEFNKYESKIDKLKQTINNLRKSNWWEFWK